MGPEPGVIRLARNIPMSQQQTIEAIDMETIEQLNSKLSQLALTNKILLVLLVALVFGSANALQSTNSIQASSIQIVDSDGKLVAELGVRDGSPGLYIFDDTGTIRASVFHSEAATGLYVNDEEAVTRIGIAQFSHGGGGVALHGPKSKGGAVLYLKQTGSLRFFDNEGNVTNQVLANPK